MRVHAIEVGSLQFPEGWFSSQGMLDILRSVLRGRGGPDDEIPILSYVVEHDDGHIVIDTGLNHRVVADLERHWLFKRFDFVASASDEIGPQMRTRGLSPEDVRWVLPTHLDADHAGGVGHFPNAQFLVHRPEWEFGSTRIGRLRFQPQG